MAAFRGRTFLEEDVGGASEPNTEEDLTVTHFPGGNLSSFQSGGNLNTPLEIAVVVSEAELAALKSVSPSIGTLVYHAGSRNVRLSAVLEPAKQHASHYWRARLRVYFL